ncbi:hypothetical protein ES703_113513 [subsurface metagenome]
MSRVLVAVVLNEILGRPAVHAGAAIEEPVVNTIVGVGAVTMHNFAEQTLSDHVQYSQVVAPEAPVFQHHAGDARLLRCIDQFPAFFEGIGRRDLDPGILAGLHSMDGHGGVPFPIGGDDNCVYIVTINQLLPNVFITAVNIGLGKVCPDNSLLGSFSSFGIDVAHRADFNVIFHI